jgi:hypothetical protein
VVTLRRMEARAFQNLEAAHIPAMKALAVTHGLCFLSKLKTRKSLLPISAAAILLLGTTAAHAGGPKYVAGVSYFNPGVKGQPVLWPGGHVAYYVDRGALGTLSNAQAVTLVDASAAIWSAVPTAAVSLTDAGSLAEDVNGGNVLPGNGLFTQPSDIAPSATTTPVAVVFDTDGSVIDALQGTGASQPGNCSQNGVLAWIDAMNPNATLTHGVIVLNGRCTTSANLLAMMSYQWRGLLAASSASISLRSTTMPSPPASPMQRWPGQSWMPSAATAALPAAHAFRTRPPCASTTSPLSTASTPSP